jgi:succinyl-diaminopimelate desuccinylase
MPATAHPKGAKNKMKRNSRNKVLLAALAAGSVCVAAAAERGNLDIEFVKGLIAIPSESRSIPECNRATAYLKDYLERRGVHCHVERTEEGRDALYAATLPGKEHDYAFVTHIDVVPAADPSQFQPKVVGDEIWGRGACDTKVNAALIAQVLVNLAGKASVGAFFATDEDGCAGKVPTCTMLRRAGFTPKKMVLVGDTLGDSTNRLFTAQKGHWGFRITAKGRGGHSSIPWKLDNAIPKITKAVDSLMAAYPKPPAGTDWYSTLAPTILSAGDAPNSIPGEASATFSFRYIGKNDVAWLSGLVRQTTGLEPETLYCVPPVTNNPDDPLIKGLFNAMQANWKDREFKIANLYGATDAFQFSDLDLPTVIFTHDGAGAHKPDEHGSLASAAEYLDFFTKWIPTL